jgi:hypothetical protein
VATTVARSADITTEVTTTVAPSADITTEVSTTKVAPTRSGEHRKNSNSFFDTAGSKVVKLFTIGIYEFGKISLSV